MHRICSKDNRNGANGKKGRKAATESEADHDTGSERRRTLAPLFPSASSTYMMSKVHVHGPRVPENRTPDPQGPA